MLEVDARLLLKAVKAAKRYRPSGPLEAPIDNFSKLHERPIVVKRCCAECIFYGPGRCENFRAPLLKRRRELGESIRIPESVADRMYCGAWIERALGDLLLAGYQSWQIGYWRRHPQTSTPSCGRRWFRTHLDAERRRPSGTSR